MLTKRTEYDRSDDSLYEKRAQHVMLNRFAVGFTVTSTFDASHESNSNQKLRIRLSRNADSSARIVGKSKTFEFMKFRKCLGRT